MYMCVVFVDFFFFKHKTAYEMRISDWSSDGCSSDLFAILLPDELMIGRKNGSGCMKQMVEAYGEVGGNLVSVLEVPHEEVSSYGVIAPGELRGKLTEVRGLVEKPAADKAPSNKIVSGRYILQPEVMRVLEAQGKGAGGEVQLTDAMAKMIGP